MLLIAYFIYFSPLIRCFGWTYLLKGRSFIITVLSSVVRTSDQVEPCEGCIFKTRKVGYMLYFTAEVGRQKSVK